MVRARAPILPQLHVPSRRARAPNQAASVGPLTSAPTATPKSPSPPQTPVVLSLESSRHLIQINSDLNYKIDSLTKQLEESRAWAKSLEEARLALTNEQLDKARSQGHGEMLEELENLWRSEHFSLELLYNFLDFNHFK